MKQRLIQVGTADNLRRGLYGRRIVVRLRALNDEQFAVVRALAFAQDVQRERNRLTCALDDPDRMTPLVVRALVETGAEIQAVTEEQHSLEEVYLNLVHQSEVKP